VFGLRFAGPRSGPLLRNGGLPGLFGGIKLGRVRLGSEAKDVDTHFLDLVRERSGEDPGACYQCGKCTGGCPAGFAMDDGPRRIMRYIQLGLRKKVLQSSTIWLCASCNTCSVRCPRGIDVAKVMECLRQYAFETGEVSEETISGFNQVFLDSVKRHGRVFELELILGFNLKSRQPFKDALMGPAMLQKGKVSLLPERIKGREEVKRIFERIKVRGGMDQ